MGNSAAQVDGYIRKNKRWAAELAKLRTLVLDAGLTEDVKWRVPVYTYEGHNVVFLGTFKDCCSISFTKGSLMKDPRGVLEMPGPNTQSARVIRLRDMAHITRIEPAIKALIREAVRVERAGEKVDFKAKRELVYPDELTAKFDQKPALKKAFESLTPGRQRAYVMHFAGAKQSKTRTSRIQKHEPRILDGKGLDD